MSEYLDQSEWIWIHSPIPSEDHSLDDSRRRILRSIGVKNHWTSNVSSETHFSDEISFQVIWGAKRHAMSPRCIQNLRNSRTDLFGSRSAWQTTGGLQRPPRVNILSVFEWGKEIRAQRWANSCRTARSNVTSVTKDASAVREAR